MGEVLVDRYRIVFFVFLIHGVGCLLPWNFVITAKEYFEDRLKTDNRTISYATDFLPYIGIASKMPNIAFQALNFFLLGGLGTLCSRILFSIVFQIISFIVLIVLVVTNLDALTFYWLTIAVVVAINVGNGIYQNCLYGSAALLPSKFTNALVIGNNISGVFSALLLIFSIAVAPDPTKSTFFYFLSAVLYLVICFATYILVQKNSFYRHYKNQQLAEDDLGLTENNGEPEPVNASKVFACLRQIWPMCLNTFLVFFVSLTLFPSVVAGVKQSGTLMSNDYFTAVSCFLLFNLFAMIGNYSSEYLPKIPRKVLWLPVLMRFAFIPLFLFCNYAPETRKYPVLIHSDLIYMLLVVLHGFTSGWLSSLSMMYTPKTVDPKYKSIAGMVSSFCLIVGIMAGIYTSIIWSKIMTNA